MGSNALSGPVIMTVATLVVAVLMLAFILSRWLRRLAEHERAVLFRLGKFTSVQGPGVVMTLPLIDRLVVVSLNTIRVEVPALDLISWDGQALRLLASLYIRITDPKRAVLEMSDYEQALMHAAQNILQKEISSSLTGQVRAGLVYTARSLQETLSSRFHPFGITIEDVEIEVQEPAAAAR